MVRIVSLYAVVISVVGSALLTGCTGSGTLEERAAEAHRPADDQERVSSLPAYTNDDWDVTSSPVLDNAVDGSPPDAPPVDMMVPDGAGDNVGPDQRVKGEGPPPVSEMTEGTRTDNAVDAPVPPPPAVGVTPFPGIPDGNPWPAAEAPVAGIDHDAGNGSAPAWESPTSPGPNGAQPTPEPATWILLAVSAGAGALLKRRRRE